MRKIEIYRVLIKFMGLYFLIVIVGALINPISSMIIYKMIDEYVWPLIFKFLFAISVFWLFFIKTNWILRIMRIDSENSDDLIDFKDAKKEAIWDFAVVIVGGLLMVEHIPIFLSNLFYQFQTMAGQNEVTASYVTDMKVRVAVHLFGIVVGYLMITNRQRISKWIAKFGDSDKPNEV
jgi:hypothetical protein